MATTQQIRNAIRTAAQTCGVDFTGQTTYTDKKPYAVYVGFPMPFGESGNAGAIATEANFLLFLATGEKNVVRVVRAVNPKWGQSGRTYLRATAG